MSSHNVWLDHVSEINDNTRHICAVYARERKSGNISPWLPVVMSEGARITADAARAMVDILGRPDDRNEWPTRRLLECRNALRKVRRMMDDMFGPDEVNETN